MTIVNKKVIAERLRLLRSTYGLSQQEFAKKVGLSQSAISQFEKEERMPSTSALEAIANAFSLPFAELIAGPEGQEKDKEIVIAALTQKLRGMDKESIVALDRWVDKMAPPKKNDESSQS